MGTPPFYTRTQNPAKMYELIKTEKPYFPDPKIDTPSVSLVCQDFINKCLEKDSNKRLGSKNDVSEILSHEWFKELNLDDILKKKVKPEYIPSLGDM